MIEITASDIFWIGAMDKIEIGLIVMFLFALFLVFMAVDSSSVAIFLFALLLGIFFHDCMGLYSKFENFSCYESSSGYREQSANTRRRRKCFGTDRTFP